MKNLLVPATPAPTLPPPPCTATEWECPGTTRCIGYDRVCDGINHCPGNSDEGEFCSKLIFDRYFSFNLRFDGNTGKRNL